jgi:hypothetical protein
MCSVSTPPQQKSSLRMRLYVSVEVFFSREPFARAGVTSSAYIRFHLESFFNEMYILRERMNAFTVKIGREFEHHLRVGRRKARTNALQFATNDECRNIG